MDGCVRGRCMGGYKDGRVGRWMGEQMARYMAG